MNDPEFESRQKQENLSFPELSDGFWDPLSPLLMGTRDLYSGVKRPGRETRHSLPSSAKVKNEWRYTFSTCAFMPVQHSFTLTSLYLTLIHGRAGPSHLFNFKHRKLLKRQSSP